MAVIEAEGVTRRYGETVALDGVSLAVDAGEVFALVGPNGAGKTTLVRALTGTTDAEGSVSVFGQQPRTVDPDRIGLLPQSFTPADRLTARELLAYYGGLYGTARDPESVLADVGMTDAADTRYEALSGGQQRRACVATALLNDPDLLVLDEPTTGIDPAGRRALWRLLEGLADAGVTVLLTTHDMAEAQRLADRVGLLDDGRLVAVDTPEALVDRHGGDSVLTVEGRFGDGVASHLGFPADVSDGRLRVRSVPPEGIGEVVETLATAGVEYGSLTWTEPDLEDAYLSLTGRAGAADDSEGGNDGAGCEHGEEASA